MALDSPKLFDVLEDVARGRIQLPEFQRQWKWDDDRIRALISTVTLDYPLGVVMALATGGASPFKARTLAGADDAAGQAARELLLDGQQRITSLFQALYRDQPVATMDRRGNSLERWYYIDIARAVDPDADRDEAIVSVPSDRVVREDFARRVRLDLSSRAKECEAGYFPLRLVFDTAAASAWQLAYVHRDGQMDADRWQMWSAFQANVLNHILAFQVPMIRLDATTPKDAVCAVFERVNTGGVQLNVFELLTATYAGDRSWTDSHEADYNLPAAWEEVKKSLSGSYPVLGRIDKGVEHGLTSSDFLQAVSLVCTYERKRDSSAAAVACKRKDLLNLRLVDFDRLMPVLRDAFLWVGEFLTRQSIFWMEDIPYRTQLVPLAAVRAILGEAADSPETLRGITRWFWCGVLGEMYGGAVESRFPRDVEQLLTWDGAERTAPDTVAESAFFANRLDSLTTRNSAAYKGVYALLIRQGAIDWVFSDAPLTQETMIGQYVDIRQIFPKGSLRGPNGKDDGRINSIVNKTALSYQASQYVSGKPSAYVTNLVAKSALRDEWFEDVLETHLIDPAALRANDFESFYQDRSKRLTALIEEAMGKAVVFHEAADQGTAE